jgi:hypothetical protein
MPRILLVVSAMASLPNRVVGCSLLKIWQPIKDDFQNTHFAFKKDLVLGNLYFARLFIRQSLVKFTVNLPCQLLRSRLCSMHSSYSSTLIKHCPLKSVAKNTSSCLLLLSFCKRCQLTIASQILEPKFSSAGYGYRSCQLLYQEKPASARCWKTSPEPVSC